MPAIPHTGLLLSCVETMVKGQARTILPLGLSQRRRAPLYPRPRHKARCFCFPFLGKCTPQMTTSSGRLKRRWAKSGAQMGENPAFRQGRHSRNRSAGRHIHRRPKSFPSEKCQSNLLPVRGNVFLLFSFLRISGTEHPIGRSFLVPRLGQAGQIGVCEPRPVLPKSIRRWTSVASRLFQQTRL